MHSCCMFLAVLFCCTSNVFTVHGDCCFSFSVNMGMLIFVVGLMVISLISELLGGREEGREA